MYVLALFEKINIGLPVYHNVMASVKGTNSAGKELVCVSNKDIPVFSACHCRYRYARTVGCTYIKQLGVITVTAFD